MNFKFPKSLVITLVVIAVVAIAVAQTSMHRDGCPGRHGHLMRFLVKKLQLTDAQQTQIKSIWQAKKPTIQPLLQQLAGGRQEMLALTANGSFDEAKVRTLANQQAQTLAQLTVEKERLISQVYNQVLTPDQRTKFDQMRAQQVQRLNGWVERAMANNSLEQ